MFDTQMNYCIVHATANTFVRFTGAHPAYSANTIGATSFAALRYHFSMLPAVKGSNWRRLEYCKVACIVSPRSHKCFELSATRRVGCTPEQGRDFVCGMGVRFTLLLTLYSYMIYTSIISIILSVRFSWLGPESLPYNAHQRRTPTPNFFCRRSKARANNTASPWPLQRRRPQYQSIQLVRMNKHVAPGAVRDQCDLAFQTQGQAVSSPPSRICLAALTSN